MELELRQESPLAATATGFGLLALAVCVVGYGITSAVLFSAPVRFLAIGFVLGLGCGMVLRL
jgi:hypothetical protein